MTVPNRNALLALLPVMATLLLSAQDAPLPNEDTIVQVNRVLSTGSRISTLSIVHLMGIGAGSKVNKASVNQACSRLTSTGLFKSIDYKYLAYPDKPGVELNLTIVDEAGLVPGRIEPEKDDAVLWDALRKIDPLFTREFPPNENAIAFYARNFDRCLKSMGRADEYVSPALDGKPGGNPSAVVFHVKRQKNATGGI